jgi:hypothetical protein
MRPSKSPKLLDTQEGIHACGADCFLLNQADSMVFTSKRHALTMTPWSPSDEETLGCLLNVAPDLNPCGLSKLCRKPCWEVSTSALRRVLKFTDHICQGEHLSRTNHIGWTSVETAVALAPRYRSIHHVIFSSQDDVTAPQNQLTCESVLL